MTIKKELLAPLEWHNETRLVKELVPYEYNPRIITEERLERLKKSLDKFNLAEIPAINTDNVIIAGHQRVKVLMALGRGEETIDVRVPNRKLTDEEYKEYNITSNVSVGYWDIDILEEVFQDIDLDILGLDINNLEIPGDFIPDELKHEEEGEVDPEPPAEPISITGDIYTLKSKQKKMVHRILCGDATEKKDYEKLMEKQNLDLTVTDPPYNVNYEGGTHTSKRQKIKNDNLENRAFYEFLLKFYQLTFEATRKGGGIYVFHSDTEGLNFRKAFQNANFKLSQCLVWVKNTFTLCRQDYHWRHEPILYGWKEGAGHYFVDDRTNDTVIDDQLDYKKLKKEELLVLVEKIMSPNTKTTVLYHDKPNRSAEHPTMKPIGVLAPLVKNSSKQGNNIGDMFLGSGSTLITCEQTWRNCYGMELDPGYIDVTIKRWLNYMINNNLEFEIHKNGKLLQEKQFTKYLD